MLKFIESKKGNALLIVISILLFALCFLKGDSAKNLEIYGTAFGLIQAVLIMFNKKENWIFYNSYIIAFLILSIIFKLYGDVFENAIYIVLGIIGTMSWYKAKTNKDSKVSYMNKKERIIAATIMLVISMVMYIYLKTTNDPQPMLDAITTSMGLVATYLMAKKKVEAWVIWFIDDILMAIIYFLIPEQPIYLLALNIIWTLLAVGSFIAWHKLAKEGKKGC
jgi:nicotinamide mononucleotide transporter PnuC